MQLDRRLIKIINDDGRYPPGAFAFVREGVSTKGHSTGQEVCQSLRKLATQRWGLLAGVVLARWGIRSTMDFGNIVYLLIEHGYMGRSETDSIEDFRDVYDFNEAFGENLNIEIKE